MLSRHQQPSLEKALQESKEKTFWLLLFVAARRNLHSTSTLSKDLETPQLTKRKAMPGPGFGPGFGGPFGGPFGPGPGLMVRRSPFAFLSVGHDPTAFALGPLRLK